MSKEIESQVSAALRPVAPREDFSQRLLARVMAEKPAHPKARRLLAESARPMAWWFTASLAACLILAVGVQQHLQQQRLRQSGLEARREVMEALRMTGQKLNLAYQAVKDQSTPPADEESGV
jgi:hypothetical protein